MEYIWSYWEIDEKLQLSSDKKRSGFLKLYRFELTSGKLVLANTLQKELAYQTKKENTLD